MAKLIPSLVFIAILSFTIQSISAVYLADYYLINAGSLDNYTLDPDQRVWSSLPATPQVTVTGNRVAAKAVGNDVDVQNPYSSALISDTVLTLSIPIKEPGWKFVRLYFQSTDYEVMRIRDAKFHVRSGYFTLLNSFRPANFGPRSFVIEFSIPVISASELVLEFVPENSKSFAFVNGVEVVSHPDFYSGQYNLIDNGNSFIIDDLTALENYGRVNVGGKQISIGEDSGFYRFWDTDLNDYLTGETGVELDAADFNTTVIYPSNFSDSIAPSQVYQTARSIGSDFNKNILLKMTWKFPVDSGSYYMVKLHFCEIMGSMIDTESQRIFNIFINDKLVESGADLIAWTNKPGTPTYKDYFLSVPDSKEIVLGLAPDLSSETEYYDTLLNGVEVFRVIVLMGANDAKKVPKSLEERMRFGMLKHKH